MQFLKKNPGAANGDQCGTGQPLQAEKNSADVQRAGKANAILSMSTNGIVIASCLFYLFSILRISMKNVDN
jgi:hypothetical protein